MRDRYLAFIPDQSGKTGNRATAFARYAHNSFFNLVERPGLLALTTGRTILIDGGEQAQGLVAGAIYRRGGRAPVTAFTPTETIQIATSDGAMLCDNFWGSYVALVAGQEGGWVLRAPFGDLACYYVRTDNGTLIASDPALLIDPGGTKMKPNWNAIALQLIAPGIRRRRTCLAALAELTGGERLEPGGTHRTTALWSPWDHVAPNGISTSPSDVAHNLRQLVCDAVTAQTAQYGRTVLLLSGGLDSSIVAAALASAGRDCTALTMITHSAGGDERDHARRVADRCGFALAGVVRRTRDVDVTRSLAADRPYPIEKSFAQATIKAATALASDTNASAVLDGGGGDNIFCSLQSAAPLADLLRSLGPGRPAISLMRDIATIAQASHAAIGRQALHRLLRRSPAYRWHIDLSFLTPDTAALADAAVSHPWLKTPRGALPGKAAHIGLILGALGLVQSPSASTDIAAHGVLLAQPVIEACLAVPSWLWYERGRNRAIARNAFAALLPPENAWRQSKGTMDSFIVEIFEANRTRIRDLLADGQLVANGLVDRQAMLDMVDAPGPVRGRAFGRIMHFVDVEAWLAAWN